MMFRFSFEIAALTAIGLATAATNLPEILAEENSSFTHNASLRGRQMSSSESGIGRIGGTPRVLSETTVEIPVTCTDDRNYFYGRCFDVQALPELGCPWGGSQFLCARTCNEDCACVNDTDPRFERDPAKDCDWIATREGGCSEDGAMEKCPEVCNPACATTEPTVPTMTVACVDDPDYGLPSGHNFYDCAWVAEDPDDRCDSFIGAEYWCPKTCVSRCACANDPNYAHKGNASRGCGFVGKKPESRCLEEGATEGCPEVCDPACDAATTSAPEPIGACENDPNYAHKGNASRGCGFVGKKPESRCLEEGATEGCPEVCDPACDAATTTAPEPIGACENDPNYAHKGNAARGCGFVGKKMESRCLEEGATEGCPEVCDPSCSR